MSKELDELVTSFGEKHYEEKALKNVLDAQNKRIKEIFEAEKINVYSTDKYTAKVTEIENDKIDENRMLEILKADWVKKYGSMECPYIKQREYVDFDALEPIMYAGELSKDVMRELDKCRTTTIQKRLTISKVKSKKED